MGQDVFIALQWRNNEHDGVSNHQPHECLLRRRSQKTSKLRVTGLCAGNSPETGEFPAEMASNAENVSILMMSSWNLSWRESPRLWSDSARKNLGVRRKSPEWPDGYIYGLKLFFRTWDGENRSSGFGVTASIRIWVPRGNSRNNRRTNDHVVAYLTV